MCAEALHISCWRNEEPIFNQSAVRGHLVWEVSLRGQRLHSLIEAVEAAHIFYTNDLWSECQNAPIAFA